jgi:hypothetical protein
MKGLFCANFAKARDGWKACEGVWCGACYTAPEKVKFYRHAPKDEEGFHWARKSFAKRHMHARDGDHLVTPFQCDLCVFRNLQGRNPGPHDELLMECIRQANLDALWGREASTVDSTLRAARQTIKMLAQVQLRPPYPMLGPFPTEDNQGYAVAIAMLLKSREPGRYAGYQQFESIRKLRAGYSNIYMASLAGSESLRTVGGEKSKFFLNHCPTHSLWFERFARGCLSRMGQIVRQDRAVSLEVMHAFQTMMEEEWLSATSLKDKSTVASLGAYSLIAFCGSFRGPEVFLVDLHGLMKYMKEEPNHGDKEYVIIPLLGRFKNELGEQYHLTPLIGETKSGLKLRLWVKRLIEVRTAENQKNGPAFGYEGRTSLPSDRYEQEILERFQAIQSRRPDLISADTQVLEDYGISRSFRRGTTSEARARGVKGEDVDLANRWRNFEGAKGRRPRLSMKDHYSDIRLLIPALLRFSEQL